MNYARLVICVLLVLITQSTFAEDMQPPAYLLPPSESIANGSNYEDLFFMSSFLSMPEFVGEPVKELMYSYIKPFYPEIFKKLNGEDVFAMNEAKAEIEAILKEKIAKVNKDKVYSCPTYAKFQGNKYDFEKECFQDVVLDLCVGTCLVMKKGKSVGQLLPQYGENIKYEYGERIGELSIELCVFTPQSMGEYLKDKLMPTKLLLQVACPKAEAKRLLNGQGEIILPAEIKIKPIIPFPKTTQYGEYPQYSPICKLIACTLLSYRVFTDNTRTVEYIKGEL